MITWKDEDGKEYALPDSYMSVGDVTMRRKAAVSATRLRTLAVKAAKYAADPVKSPALTARETHELLARLALAEAADDL